MTGLFGSEVRKLWTVRTTWALTLIGLGLAVLSTSTTVFSDVMTRPGTGAQVNRTAETIDQLGANSVLVLVVGLLVMTTEFRHATIGRTLQLEPSRTRVLLAKLATGALYATVFFGFSLILAAGLLVVGAALDYLTIDTSGAVWRAVWQGWIGMTLTGLLGVAVGSLLRSQVVAITGSLVWLLIVENLAAALRPDIGRWLPFQALAALFVPADTLVEPGFVGPLPPGVALAVFLAYVVVATVAAGVLLRRRDV